MTHAQLLTLILIQNLPDKSGINPENYFGIQDWVQKILDDPTEGMKALLNHIGITWDGTGKIWPSIHEQVKVHCAVNLVAAQHAVDERRKEDALEIVAYDKACPHTLSRLVVNRAREVILGRPLVPADDVVKLESLPIAEEPI